MTTSERYNAIPIRWSKSDRLIGGLPLSVERLECPCLDAVGHEVGEQGDWLLRGRQGQPLCVWSDVRLRQHYRLVPIEDWRPGQHHSRNRPQRILSPDHDSSWSTSR